MFREDSPAASDLITHSSYVDDLIDSRPSKSDALKTAKEVEDILAKGGFSIKCWQFSGESSSRVYEQLAETDYESNKFVQPTD
jgi:hypothetical protein